MKNKTRREQRVEKYNEILHEYMNTNRDSRLISCGDLGIMRIYWDKVWKCEWYDTLYVDKRDTNGNL